MKSKRALVTMLAVVGMLVWLALGPIRNSYRPSARQEVQNVYRARLFAHYLRPGSTPPIERRFNWSVTVRPVAGEIQERVDRQLFEAPDTGYKPVFVIEMNDDSDPWSYNLERSFIIRFHDGSHGRFSLDVSAPRNKAWIDEAFRNTGTSRSLFP
jgi:hypothetical protein